MILKKMSPQSKLQTTLHYSYFKPGEKREEGGLEQCLSSIKILIKWGARGLNRIQNKNYINFHIKYPKQYEK